MRSRQKPDEGNKTPADLLQHMARRASEREPGQYFGGLLDLYARQEGLSELQLEELLGIRLGRPWTRLALCGRPRSQGPMFWHDVQDIATYTGANPDGLVAVVRSVETLETMQGLPRNADDSLDAGLLAAARDQSEIEEPPASDAFVPMSSMVLADSNAANALPLWLDAGIQTAVAQFWEAAGTATPAPMHLQHYLLRSLPCVVAYLPQLTLARIEAWLGARDIPYRFPCANRALRGCLLAYRGAAIIFIDAADSPEEQRYTIAHELAHFLLDYLKPRNEAIGRLGPEIADVLDGRRQATVREQVEAGFEQVSIYSYFHLMDRARTNTRGAAVRTTRSGMSDLVLAAENLADRVALELLAPSEVIIARLIEVGIQALGDQRSQFVAAARTILQEEYQLPAGPALVYAATLASAFDQPRTTEDWLTGL